VLIALITGYLGLIAALPHIQGIQAAKMSGGAIFSVIDRVPKVKDCPNPSTSLTLDKCIKYENVTFKYPTALPE